jgi:hypothetical protein
LRQLAPSLASSPKKPGENHQRRGEKWRKMALLRGSMRHFAALGADGPGSQAAKLRELTSTSSRRFQPPAARQGAIFGFWFSVFGFRMSLVSCQLSVAGIAPARAGAGVHYSLSVVRCWDCAGPGGRLSLVRCSLLSSRRTWRAGVRRPLSRVRCSPSRLAEAGQLRTPFATDKGQRTIQTIVSERPAERVASGRAGSAVRIQLLTPI